MRNPLLPEPLDRNRGCRKGHRDLMATAAYSGKQALRMMRHENEQGSRRRFLQVFQERVGRGGLHGLSGMNQDNFVTVLMARYVDEISEIADLLDLDVNAWFLFRFCATRVRWRFLRGRCASDLPGISATRA